MCMFCFVYANLLKVNQDIDIVALNTLAGIFEEQKHASKQPQWKSYHSKNI